MRLYRKVIRLLLQAALAVALIWPTVVSAQTSTPIRLLDINAELAETGELQIRQEIQYPAPARLNWVVFGAVSDVTISVDGQSTGLDKITLTHGKDQLRIVSPNTTGLTWNIYYKTRSQLFRSDERDQIYLPILKESGAGISLLQIRFQLPAGTTGDGLVGNLYAIGGVNQSTTRTDSSREVIATSQQIGPKAIVTLNAHWPTSLLRLTPTQELRLALANLELLPWLVLGLFLPLISFMVLLRLLLRQRHQETVHAPDQSSPPEPLSPLIVGTLIDKKVYPQEIVAMLIDLCRRGYVVIVKKSGQYSLSQRKPLDTGLEPWERDVLESLFPIANAKVTAEQVSQINRQSLFSPKIRRAFSAMYEVVTAKGFFTENPHQTRVRYKLFALSLYFSSVIGAIWIAVSGASPYLLLPVAGNMLVCRLIIAYTPGLVHYTPTGRKARAAWVAFGRYLATAKSLPLEDARNQVFEKYLGYAVALGQTTAWAKRFDLSNTVIVKPDWFISYEETSTAQFAGEIEEFSSAISKLLTEMRGPLVS